MSISKTLKALCPTISVGLPISNIQDLGSELAKLDGTGVGLLHIDVMDGCFTPVMTLGPPIVEAIHTPFIKDVHLMIQDPLEKLEDYVQAGADIITVHVESTNQIHRVLQRLGDMANTNCQNNPLIRGIALNPGTPLEVLAPLLDEVDLILLLAINPGWGGQTFLHSTFKRITQTRKMIAKSGNEILLSIDGGITKENFSRIVDTGIDIVVSGSAVFDGLNPAGNARLMLDTIRTHSP